MSSIDHLKSIILDLPPCCIEFWPLNPQYAVVGTYNLEKPAEGNDGASAELDKAVSKTSQQRNGSLILLRVLGDDV